MKSRISVAAVLLLLSALLIPGTSQSNPQDLAGAVGPGGEELGAGGDDDLPSHSIDVSPTRSSPASTRLYESQTVSPGLNSKRSWAACIRRISADLTVRVSRLRLIILGTGADDN
jgi:hypothetical protein